MRHLIHPIERVVNVGSTQALSNTTPQRVVCFFVSTCFNFVMVDTVGIISRLFVKQAGWFLFGTVMADMAGLYTEVPQ